MAVKQRSALALLGIVIGTASVVAMLTIGHMASNEALRLFSRMGVDKLVVQADGVGPGMQGLDPAIVEALPQRLPAILRSAPVLTGHVEVDVGGAPQSAGVAATTPALQRLVGLQLSSGRFLEAVDDGEPVAVVGAAAASLLSQPGAPISVGSHVRLGRYLFAVVGVLKPGPTTAFDPTDFNAAVIIPLGSSHRALGQTVLNAAVAQVRPGIDANIAAAALGDTLKQASPKAQLQVQSARALIQTLKVQKAVHTRLLAAIGGISLLVGGIGIMNVMLMGVMERRREIGLRAAIGATPHDIQLMFLIEAAALALVGGVTGALLGVAVAFAVAAASGWAFSLALYSLPLGAGVATIVGLGFGLYPAVKASQLHPIEALRAE
jgi:putative ABC transport system permease protein